MNNQPEQIFLLDVPADSTQTSNLSIGTCREQNGISSNTCRTCATVTEVSMPIFYGEGSQNNLADKIQKHLPIQVSPEDGLPQSVCYQCANTLLAWHELVECCVQADRALRQARDSHLQMQKSLINKDVLKKLKKDEATDKKAILATGGGSHKPLLTDVGAQMLGLVGNQIKPLKNNCDSASSYFASVTLDETGLEATNDVPNEEDDQSIKPTSSQSTMRKTGKIEGASNVGAESLKIKFYKKKLESAIIEKKMKLAMYQTEIKKKSLIDFDLKIKQLEYNNLLKNCT